MIRGVNSARASLFIALLLAGAGAASPRSAWGGEATGFFSPGFFFSGACDLRVFEENDALVPWKGTDESYTNGARVQLRLIGKVFARSSGGGKMILLEDGFGNLMTGHKGKAAYLAAIEEEGLVKAPGGAEIKLAVDSSSGKYYVPAARSNLGLFVGQNIYTPADKSHLEPQREGRPYAGWLYAGVFLETITTEEFYYRYGLQLGCVGPCAFAEKTQTWIHRHIVSSPVPQGWGNQIKDEFGAVLNAELRKTALKYPGPGGAGRRLDLALLLEGNAGNIFTDVSAGLIIRLGRLEPYYSGYGISPPPPAPRRDVDAEALAAMEKMGLRAIKAGKASAGKTGDERYLFLRAEFHGVMHNALLQGGQYGEDDPHTVTPYRLICEGEIGAAYHNGAYTAQFGIGSISSEFTEEAWVAIRHVYGKFQLGVVF